MIPKKTLLIITFFMLIANNLFAQISHKKQIKFRSYNEAGLSVGANANAVFINSVNGFEKKKFFLGLGMGADFYYHTSIPVFLQGNYTIPLQKNALQLITGAGMNKPVNKPNPKYESAGAAEYSTGYYFSSGIQYLVKLKTHTIYFGTGYIEKQMLKEFDMSLIDPSTQISVSSADLRFKRIYLKAGIRF